jgi:LL-diaminopimelate aminotransferase
MKINSRLNGLTEYHFKRIEETKLKLLAKGKKLYDFGIGDPDLSVSEDVIKALITGFSVKGFNKYPPYDGIKELKKGIINYYNEIYNVSLNMDEVVVLIGSKEGLNNIIPAICGIGDSIIVPDPAYPVYEICAKLWGVETYKITLNENERYLPSINSIPQDILTKSKMLFINYPNNPTGAVADIEFYKKLVTFCNKYNIILCNDSAYNEIIKSNDKPLSILQTGTKKNCVEFGSFSKTYNMTGFRIGFAVGDVDIIKALIKVKSNVDSGQFIPIQLAALEALKMDRSAVLKNRLVYDARRTMMEHILKSKNIKYFKPEGTFYVWCNTPEGYTTEVFCEELLLKFGIVVTPGYSFGTGGNNNFRIALTQSVEIIQEAFDKIRVYN